MYLKKFCMLMTLITFLFINTTLAIAKNNFEDSKIYKGNVDTFISRIINISKQKGISFKEKVVSDISPFGDKLDWYVCSLGLENKMYLYITYDKEKKELIDLINYFYELDDADYYNYLSNVDQAVFLIKTVLSEIGVEDKEIQKNFELPFYTNDKIVHHIKDYKVYCKRIGKYIKIECRFILPNRLLYFNISRFR